MKELSKKLGDMEFDGLVTDNVPKTQIRCGIIRKQSENTPLKRGAILAKSSADGKLVLLGTTADSGETLTPDSILCDDVIDTSEDVSTSVYTAGCFDQQKTTVRDGYSMTQADYDTLRKYGIVFKSTFEN